MKKKLVFFGMFFTLFGYFVKAQVYDMYYQGFEGGEAVNYTVTPSANGMPSTDMVKSGSGAIRMVQSASSDVEYVTDVIDFTQYPSINYIKLEFDHICNISRWSGTYDVCRVYVKFENQSTWTKLTSSEYDRTKTYSSDFVTLNGFSRVSYMEWTRATLTDECWKSERFNIESIFLGVPLQNRRMQLKFVINERNDGGTVNAEQGWWLDNIRVSASPNEMVDPIISMVTYPDGGSFPNSRGARIVLDARTTALQGICSDSVYVVYTTGSDDTPTKATMSPMGTVTDHANITWRRFGYFIPFNGYDTLMRFYCVVRDSTTNYNSMTYPAAANSWVEYWHVRGVEQPGVRAQNFVGTSNYEWLPFPRYADNMSEWVYDSALLADAGYGPGAHLLHALHRGCQQHTPGATEVPDKDEERACQLCGTGCGYLDTMDYGYEGGV